MRVLRWIEAVSGILAGVAGGVAIAYLLTTPIYRGASCYVATPGEPPICVTSTATLLQINGATAIVDLCIVAVLLLGVAIPAVWHSLTGQRGAQWILWGSTTALLIFTLLGIFTIGAFLLPAAAFALIASLCALTWNLIRNQPTDGIMTPRHT